MNDEMEELEVRFYLFANAITFTTRWEENRNILFQICL